MKKAIVLSIIIIFISPLASKELEQKKGDILYVLALSGLNLRDKPDPSGKSLENINYGVKVVVLEVTQKEFTAENIKSCWIKVRVGTKEGYLFGGFLSHLPAPELKNADNAFTNLKDYAEKKLGRTGSAVKKGDTTVQKYNYGVQITEISVEGGGFSQTTMSITGVGLSEAFLLGRAVAVSMDWWFSTKDLFPIKNSTYKETYKTRDGQVFKLNVSAECKKNADGDITEVMITKNNEGYQRTLWIRQENKNTVGVIMAVND